jgi:hypothetical protein
MYQNQRVREQQFYRRHKEFEEVRDESFAGNTKIKRNSLASKIHELEKNLKMPSFEIY